MKSTTSNILDITELQPEAYWDNRGFFVETFRESWFVNQYKFVQDNQSASYQNVLRGLHYQTHDVQGKLVRVVNGTIFDVAVDIRRYSPTFGKWVYRILSAFNFSQLWIPPGFAHGFWAMDEFNVVVYKTTKYYDPQSNCTILWNDPDLNISWPLKDNKTPLLSENDAHGTLFKDAKVFETEEDLLK